MNWQLVLIFFLPLFLSVIIHSLPKEVKERFAGAVTIIGIVSILPFLISFLFQDVSNRETIYKLYELSVGGSSGIRFELVLNSISKFFSLLAVFFLLVVSFQNFVEKKESFLPSGYAEGILIGLSGTLLIIFAANLFTFIIGFQLLILSFYSIDSATDQEVAGERGITFLALQFGIFILFLGAALLDKGSFKNFLSASALDLLAGDNLGYYTVFFGILWIIIVLMFRRHLKRAERVYFPIQIYYLSFALPGAVFILLFRIYDKFHLVDTYFAILAIAILLMNVVKTLLQVDSRGLVITINKSFFAFCLWVLSSSHPETAMFLFSTYSSSIIAIGLVLTLFVENIEHSFTFSKLENLQEKSPPLFWLLAIVSVSLVGFPGTSGSFPIIGGVAAIFNAGVIQGIISILSILFIAFGIARLFLSIGVRQKTKLDFNFEATINPISFILVGSIVLFSLIIGYFGLPNFGEGAYSLKIQKYFLNSISLENQLTLDIPYQGVLFSILPLLFLGLFFFCYNIFINSKFDSYKEKSFYKLFNFLEALKAGFYIGGSLEKLKFETLFRYFHTLLENVIFRGGQKLLGEGSRELSNTISQMYGRTVVSGVFILLFVATLGAVLVLLGSN